MSEALNLFGFIRDGRGDGRTVATKEHVLRLDEFARATSLGRKLESLRGRSVLLCVRDMAKAAATLIELDGLARRIVLCPLEWEAWRLASAAKDAEASALVHDGDVDAPPTVDLAVACELPLRALGGLRVAELKTEWVLPTSGTTGPPKLVVHSLSTLVGAIADAPLQQWATFYDIRRYGGLQIFLRALMGRGSLTLAAPGENLGETLARFGAAKITHISGTPTHWRKVLMSGEGHRIDPGYVRLSGEIADEAILSALGAFYPRARIEHAYASTEAGVMFSVADEKPGFPLSFLDRDGTVRIKIVDGALHARSERAALRFLGENPPALADADGFVDTGDMVEKRGERFLFVGRRGGIINVGGVKIHPEEVEAALNANEFVRASRVFARKNPVTGALVCADVVLKDGRPPGADLELEILAGCRAKLPPHSVPATLRFVADLPMTAGGKLGRHG